MPDSCARTGVVVLQVFPTIRVPRNPDVQSVENLHNGN